MATEAPSRVPDLETRPSDAPPAALAAAPALRYRLLEADQLGEARVARWHELRASNPALDSPYYHPGFVAAVAATRPDVRVIVGEDAAGTVAAFLPVQFDGRTCHPAGWPANDFQGPICAPETAVDLPGMIRACGIAIFDFDHLRDGLAGMDRWIVDRQPSPYIDLSGGMDGYMSRARGSGKHKIREARRLGRKAAREHGDLRVVIESGDPALLETIIALKRRQYAATGARDYFADPARAGLLHRLLAADGRDFGGMLSALYAGPELVAAHFGMRSGPVLHWWFPVYNPDMSRLDPGWMLLRAVIEAAPELGLERLDLGRGRDEWKRRAGTGQQIVCQGAVIPNRLRHGIAVSKRRAVEAVRTSPVAPAVRSAVHRARRRAR